MPTQDERLNSIEDNINRMMELLQEVATVDDATDYTDVQDARMQTIYNRMDSLEAKLQALVYKWQIAIKKNS